MSGHSTRAKQYHRRIKVNGNTNFIPLCTVLARLQIVLLFYMVSKTNDAFPLILI